MPPVVTFSPDSPRPALDGINLYVTGEVSVPGRIVIYRNSDDKLVGQSPAQGQDAPFRSAEVLVSLTGDPTGGDFTLGIDYAYGDADTDAIAFDATAEDIRSAIESALRGDGLAVGLVSVEGDAPGPVTIRFSGEYGDRPVTVTGDGTGLTGGTSPDVDVTEVYPGGKDPDGITQLWLPALLLPEGVYDVDLVYAGGDDDGESMLDDMIQIYVEE
jgi:hypothetical protein